MHSREADFQGDSDNNEEVSSPSLSDRLSETLPLEMVEEIFSYFSTRELGLFARVSRKTEEETTFIRLLHCIVYAEPESYKQADKTRLAAIAMLKRHPEFLFKEGTVTDHFGRKIKGSLYRVLLGTGDVWALKQVHEEIIAKIKDEKERAKAEDQTESDFQAQFPNCPWPLPEEISEEMLYDDRNIAQIAQLEEHLKIVVEKITADPCTKGEPKKVETIKAVEDLLQIFALKKGEIVDTGLHVPQAMFYKILKTYDTQFEPWTANQLAFFSREVIGGAEAALTVVDGQGIKNGLKNLEAMKEKGPDRTDGLFCRHPQGIPLERAPLAGKLGRTAFIDPYDGYSCVSSSTLGLFDWYNKNGCLRAARGGRMAEDLRAARDGLLAEDLRRRLGPSFGARGFWKTYGEQKQKSMGAIMRRCQEKSTHCPDEHNRSMRCVIS